LPFKIKIRNYDRYLKSNRTIKLLRSIKNKNKNAELYFIMGSDSLLNLHKWDDWKKFKYMCNIVVFPRLGYFNKTFRSKAYKFLGKENIIFLKSKIVDISSSKLRKNYLL